MRNRVTRFRQIASAVLTDGGELSVEADANAIDEMMLDKVEYCIRDAVHGLHQHAVLVHYGFERPSNNVLRAIDLPEDVDLVKHKQRAHAARQIAGYEEDQYMDAVLKPAQQDVALRLADDPPSIREVGGAPAGWFTGRRSPWHRPSSYQCGLGPAALRPCALNLVR